MKTRITMMLATALFLSTTCPAHADEAACIAGREKATVRYATRMAKAKALVSTDPIGGKAAIDKARVRYAGSWAKLQAKYPGTSCDAERFVDNGDGTVTDRLTGLVWEKKDNLGGIHDKDNTYTWTNGDADETDEDGTVFTVFLANLNSGTGFGGANGWRLPTIGELQTILLPEPYPCETIPCTDPALGPDKASYYWSASTPAYYPTIAWYVSTDIGYTFYNRLKTHGADGVDTFVRAVRSGS